MNDEITLSSNLNVITSEIHGYKNMIGHGLYEIGKRLKHVKENDLAHGEWEKYCKEEIDISPAYANRYIKVFEEFGESNQYTSIGLNKLYMIATLPEEARKEEHVTADGEIKTLDEMTVRELQELKKKLNQKDEQIKEQQRVIEHYATKRPEVVEKIVEVEKEVVHPHVDDLRSDNKQLSDALRNAKAEADAATKRNEFLEREIKELYETRKEVDEKSRRYEELTEGIQRLEGKMNENQQMLASQKRVLDTIRGGNDLLDKLSGLIYATDLETLTGNELVHVELNKLMQRVEWWFNDLNKKIDSTTILEGEIIND